MDNNSNYNNKYLLLRKWLDDDKPFTLPPEQGFLYSPRRGNSFSYIGERMVNHLVCIGMYVDQIFSTLISHDLQKQLISAAFERLKGSKFDKPGKKGEMGYFRTNRSFSSLTPSSYRRTPKAPRLTTAGNTAHGMNKALLVEVLKDVTNELRQICIIELDINACHTRIASSLLYKGNLLSKALSGTNFWDEQTSIYIESFFKAGIDMNKKMLKRIMKVGLYTSLNGGVPSSHDRLVDNLLDNARDFWPEKKLTTSPIYTITKEVLSELPVIKEVKGLNKECYMAGLSHSYTYTVDRVIPYENTADYKGISRVLQGFEVVLLTRLASSVINTNGLPLSLDHDGLLVMYEIDKNQSSNNDFLQKFVQEREIELTNKLSVWSNYLLGSPTPIEAKRYWCKGQVKEM